MILAQIPLVIEDCPDFKDYYLFIISCFHMHSTIKKIVNEIAVELENSLKKAFQNQEDEKDDGFRLIFMIVKSFILTISLSGDNFDKEYYINENINLIKKHCKI